MWTIVRSHDLIHIPIETYGDYRMIVLIHIPIHIPIENDIMTMVRSNDLIHIPILSERDFASCVY